MPVHIVDSHIHFWDQTQLRYPWLDDLPALNKPFLPDHASLRGEGWVSDALVFVDAGCLSSQCVAEAEWVTSLAQKDARIQAIVAHTPLEEPHPQKTLEALQALPLVKGIRRLIQSEAPGFCEQPTFIEGIQMLPNYGFSFDLCIRHHQMAEITALVARCPNVSFVLDHIGKPGIKDGLLDPWRAQLKALAQYPNVVCKLSGLLPEAHPVAWQSADFTPYIDYVMETFGPERVMFGSDSPVMYLIGANYDRWIEMALAALSDLSESEKQHVFSDTARRFYRL
jgi:L-fuconolactonase